MNFEAYLSGRNAADYADFLTPHLAPDFHVIDVGCGEGSIALGLARTTGHVIGVDLNEENFTDARKYATQHGIENVEFRAGSVYALDFPDDHFDAGLCHWYASSAQKYGLATKGDLSAMSQAWIEWSESDEAYAAFAWCRALGWKPM